MDKDKEENRYRTKVMYDFINPSHYKDFDIEVIEMMERIWGLYDTATYCKLCAFKYKLRMGSKPDQPLERDLEKSEWYLQRYRSLVSRLHQQGGVDVTYNNDTIFNNTNISDPVVEYKSQNNLDSISYNGCKSKGFTCRSCESTTGGCTSKPF